MGVDSGTPFRGDGGSVIFTDPAPGGGRKMGKRVSPSAPAPVPVYFMRPALSRGQQVKGAVTNTRLGTPVALLMLGGLALVYWALQGWDRKYGTFRGAFAGKGGTPSGRGETPSPSNNTGDNTAGGIA